jgi:hypothetical protein
VASHGTTSGFDLASSDAATADSFQTEITKADPAAAFCQTAIAALLYLAKLCALRL